MKLAENLKKAVLQAAMQGKLTRQLKTDSSVDDLLQKIAEEKARLIKEGKIKKESGGSLPLAPERKRSSATPSPRGTPPKTPDNSPQVLEENSVSSRQRTTNARFEPIPQEEIPFEIPENWRWVHFSDVMDIRDGTHDSPRFFDSGIPMVTSKNLKNGIIDFSNIKYVTKEVAEQINLRSNVDTGDILFAMIGSIGNPVIVNKDREFVIKNMALFKNFAKKCIKIEYVYNFLILQQVFLRSIASGGVQSFIALNVFRKMLFPLPPIEEQQRIVEKLNSILPLIDEYGKEEDELVALSQNFPEEIKKSVLQSAMQGKLTRQLQTDSSVDDLLKKIAEEKEKNNQVWKAKKQPPIEEILETIDANEIPENWKWVKLSQVAHSYIGLTYSPSNISSDGTIVLRSSNIQNGKMDYKDIVKVEMDIPENKMCKKGDILVCARNGSKSLVGKCAIIDANGMSFGAFMAIIKSPCNDYLYHYLSSPYFKKQMALDSSTVTVNQITQDMLFNACVPLPPIEEQQRIVEKLNSILPIIDSMAVYGTKKKAGRPKQEEALSFIRTFLQAQKPAQPKTAAPEILELKTKAKQELPAAVQKYAGLMGVTYNRITIRHQKTRWGSCTKTGNLNFNCLIMKMPDQVRDYVIIHELAHRKELNHSSKYWAIVAEYCPWYKQAKQWLKDNGQELMERQVFQE